MSTLPMTTVFAIALVAFAVFQIGYAIKCYGGIDDLMVEIDCSGSCVKLETNSKYGDVLQYDCYEGKAEEGCTTVPTPIRDIDKDATTTTCFCKTDLCNSSGVTMLSLPVLVGSFLLRMVI
ncbi:uncharacterized protein LOC135223317 [Macrobrachium nipponense]|uniref:uncharacterized protein LOC135223317 n=1 Tax=Macrobrachium nipponense TaxID=159736 RepID=UPI0030C82328